MQPFKLHDGRNIWDKFSPEVELSQFGYDYYEIPKSNQITIHPTKDFSQLYVYRDDVATLLQHSSEPIENKMSPLSLIAVEGIEKNVPPSHVSYTQINNSTTINQNNTQSYKITNESNTTITNLTNQTSNIVNNQQDQSSNTLNKKTISIRVIMLQIHMQ